MSWPAPSFVRDPVLVMIELMVQFWDTLVLVNVTVDSMGMEKPVMVTAAVALETSKVVLAVMAGRSLPKVIRPPVVVQVTVLPAAPLAELTLVLRSPGSELLVTL